MLRLVRREREPGPRGRLASAYLKQLRILRHKDTELRRARERNQELQASNDEVPEDLALQMRTRRPSSIGEDPSQIEHPEAARG